VVSRKAKLRTEAPVNGGRNYNGPKVLGCDRKSRCLSKIWPNAGTSEYLRLLAAQAAVTKPGAQIISRKDRIEEESDAESSET
jgi:hypothetical protein